MILKKCARLPPNHAAAIFQANIHHHALVVSMLFSRHHLYDLQMIGAREKKPHPIQSIGWLQEAAIADALANHTANKIPHSKSCAITKIKIEGQVSICH
jgi:hypothetical protein